MARYVLDTSAILAVLFDEDGSQMVVDLLDRVRTNEEASEVAIPFIALMEAEYKLLRRVPSDQVAVFIQSVESWPARIAQSTNEWRRSAAALKARGRLSLGDSWVASLAMIEDAALVHKDPEFDAIQELEALRLPYKTATRRRR